MTKINIPVGITKLAIDNLWMFICIVFFRSFLRGLPSINCNFSNLASIILNIATFLSAVTMFGFQT